MQKTDILIIGAGVSGCAVARVLSRYQTEVLVVERGHDLAEGASKANSGIVHAGFDAVPGTLKAKLNAEGARMYPGLCEELGVPYDPAGALVVAFANEERETLRELLAQGEANGIPGLEIVEHDRLMEMEPNLNPEAVAALYAPTSGLTSPYEMTYALADHAAMNGVQFRFNTRVETLRKTGDKWLIGTDGEPIEADAVILCAGTDADRLHNQISDTTLEIINRRGQYYLLDHPAVLPFSRTMFQCPSVMGKGVLVSPTVHGNVLLGPTAEDIGDGEDTATTAAGLAAVLRDSRRTWPNLNTRTAITNFSGVRAHEKDGDFLVGRVSGAAGAYEAAGIESPGLSAAPALGEYLGAMIAGDMGLGLKEDFCPAPKRPKPFNEMTDEERAAAVAADPLYGRIICRCEVVTEAEIRAAIRRPVGATSVDGVKRRTRAGMGRCQGGFCSPRVTEILAEELGIPMTEVTKSGGESLLLVGDIREALKGGDEA